MGGPRHLRGKSRRVGERGPRWGRQGLVRISSTLAVLAAVLACAAATAAAQSHRLPSILTADDSNAFAVRPARIILTADGNQLIGRTFDRRRRGYLRWRQWNRRVAVGSATYWFKDCRPSCSRSHLQLRHVTLDASQPRGGHFRLMRIDLRYRGRRYFEDLFVRHVDGRWTWETPDGFRRGR